MQVEQFEASVLVRHDSVQMDDFAENWIDVITATQHGRKDRRSVFQVSANRYRLHEFRQICRYTQPVRA